MTSMDCVATMTNVETILTLTTISIVVTVVGVRVVIGLLKVIQNSKINFRFTINGHTSGGSKCG